MVAEDVDLNIDKSTEITMPCETGRRWPALFYSSRSHPCSSEALLKEVLLSMIVMEK